MATSTWNPVKERAPTLIVADFTTEAAATSALAALRSQHQAYLIAPRDPQAARKLEPDQRGIWRTLLRSHLVLGFIGALLGLLAGWILIRSWPAAQQSPGFTLFVCTVLGLVFGMLAAGLLTLRPDRIALIRQARAALKDGRWLVAVQSPNAAQADAAMAVLRATGAKPKRSL